MAAKSKKKKKNIKKIQNNTKKNINKKKKRKINNQKKKNYNTKTKSYKSTSTDTKAKSTEKPKKEVVKSTPSKKKTVVEDKKKATVEKKKTQVVEKKKTTVIEDKKKTIVQDKEKTSKKKKLPYIILCVVLLCCYIGYKMYKSPTLRVTKTYIDDNNNLVVAFKNHFSFRDEIYCYYSNDDKIPLKNDENWVKSSNNTCSVTLTDQLPYYVYLKTEDNLIYKAKNANELGKVLSLKINQEKIYLPLKGTYEIKPEYVAIGNLNEEIIYTTSNDNVSIEANKITGVKTGNTTINIKLMNMETTLEVVVTDLITVRPKGGYDYKKGYLPCNKYSEEQNNQIDEILKARIKEAGYKTRAGVVEAARFLTLDFPYRINYFYENGRQTTNNVDGEGRYYHVGFYLHSSRYKNITGKQHGPKTWGCKMYDRPAKRNIVNGLDCSGFVSWALLNGGFDVKDVGAGWSDRLDLTDYGTVKKINSSLISSNKIRVGDLLHSERAGGHIGIIVGMDKDNYYVAQALWYDEIGVIITKIKKSNLSKHFPHAVLMDKYYKEDGNLTEMW